MSDAEAALGVLAAYPRDCRAGEIESLGGAGGFSGARFWRFRAARGDLCLRRWPKEHPTEERLRFIHALLRGVVQAGFDQVAAPLETTAGASYVRHAGSLWELAPWLPGRADYQAFPSPSRLDAALGTLARFHLAAAKCRLTQPASAPSPGMARRREQLARLLSTGLAEIQASLAPDVAPELLPRAERIMALIPRCVGQVRTTLASAESLAAPLQPCIRDIWSEHVLFEGDQVTGFIDFGAADVETVAADVARLLGSLAADDAWAWRRGLAAYEAVRPLSPAEAVLVAAFDCGAVLLAGVNWLEWIYVRKRQFDDLARVGRRLDHIVLRLEHLAGNA